MLISLFHDHATKFGNKVTHEGVVIPDRFSVTRSFVSVLEICIFLIQKSCCTIAFCMAISSEDQLQQCENVIVTCLDRSLDPVVDIVKLVLVRSLSFVSFSFSSESAKQFQSALFPDVRESIWLSH